MPPYTFIILSFVKYFAFNQKLWCCDTSHRQLVWFMAYKFRLRTIKNVGQINWKFFWNKHCWKIDEHSTTLWFYNIICLYSENTITIVLPPNFTLNVMCWMFLYYVCIMFVLHHSFFQCICNIFISMFLLDVKCDDQISNIHPNRLKVR